MIKTILVFIQIILFSFVMIAVNDECNCSRNEFTIIEKFFEERKYDTLQILIEKLPENNTCLKQRKELYKFQYSISTSDLNTADSLKKIISQFLFKKPCKPNEAIFYYHSGTFFIKKENSDSSYYYLIKAKEIAESLKDQLMVAKTWNRIAYMFNNLLDEPEKALEYNRKTLNIAKENNYNELLLLSMGNQSAYYGRIYDLREKTEYIDSVIKNANRTLQIAKKLNNARGIAQVYSTLSGSYYIKENYDKALIYCDSGIVILNKKIDFRYLHSLFYKKCDIYLELKKYDKAREYADSCLKYSLLEKEILSVKSAYERLYECEKYTGNFESALAYYEKFKSIQDSIKSDEKLKITTELEQKYNKAQNEKTIKELNQEKQISDLQKRFLIIGVLSAILIIIILFIVYKQAQVRSKMKIMETEQRLNRARMNPHFFFNSLASLQTLALTNNKQQQVSEYIHMFSKIMRETLESTFNELNTIEQEIDFLTNYLKLQKLRSENKFSYQFMLDDTTQEEINELYLPSMILQPFIENSIEHGFAKISSGGMIEIKFEKRNSNLIIEIKDNGKMGESINKHEGYPSRATEIIKDRLFLLNKKLKTNATFEIKSGASNQGTTVIIILPLIYQP